MSYLPPIVLDAHNAIFSPNKFAMEMDDSLLEFGNASHAQWISRRGLCSVSLIEEKYMETTHRLLGLGKTITCCRFQNQKLAADPRHRAIVLTATGGLTL